MNKLFIILLLIISFSGYSQYHKDKISEPVKVITLYTASIVLNAIGDGLNDSGQKGWGHACNAASIGLLLTSPFIIDYEKSKWGYYLTSYVGLRFGMFDAVYNLTRRLPYDYIGATSTNDRMIGKVPANFRTFSKGIAIIVSVSIPFNKLSHNKLRHK